MEDSDLQEEILDGKVWKAWKPYGPDLGIAALDGLFVLDDDPVAAITSGEDENENDEESEDESESVGDVLTLGSLDYQLCVLLLTVYLQLLTYYIAASGTATSQLLSPTLMH
ncbi:uncharacterized protein ARMOST_11699 [Armillaria ostoyae]|uniref:Uncharacterized protein n=1 Tax=Armillaria ostoyae TaxID=47428 RepID=A0A284RHW1_ARMOS|nr:uncharacterized protein ARMOST_11699 [Armillaria ostoyae]